MASLASTDSTLRSNGSALPPVSTATGSPTQVSTLPPNQPRSSDWQTEGQSADDFTRFRDGSRSRSARPSRRSGTLNTLLRPLRGAWSRARSAISDWPSKKHLYTAANSVIDYAKAQSRVDTALSCGIPEGELHKEKDAAYKALVRFRKALSVMDADGTKGDILAEKVIELDDTKVVKTLEIEEVDSTGERRVTDYLKKYCR